MKVRPIFKTLKNLPISRSFARGKSKNGSQEKREERGNTEVSTRNLPVGLNMRRLHWPETNSTVLLVGVNRRSGDHAFFISDLLDTSHPDCIVTNLEPDQPYWIDTNGAFDDEWKNYLSGNSTEAKFGVNPYPRYLSDLILSDKSIDRLMKGNWLNSTEHFEFGTNLCYSYENPYTKAKKPDSFFTPISWKFQNPNRVVPIVIGKFPLLLTRRYANNNCRLFPMRHQFNTNVEKIARPKIFGDISVEKSFPHLFSHRQNAYFTEIVRQSCWLGKKVVAIVDVDMADQIEQNWTRLDKGMKQLATLLEFPVLEKGKVPFVDYVEKHLLMDLMMEPFVTPWFIENRVFPFKATNTIGSESSYRDVFILWSHFFSLYEKKLEQVRQQCDEDLKHRGLRVEQDSEEPLSGSRGTRQ